MNGLCKCGCTPKITYNRQKQSLINDYYAIKTDEKKLKIIKDLENDESPEITITYIQNELEIFVYGYSDQYNEQLLSSVYKVIFGHLECRNNIFEYIDAINRISHARTIYRYSNRCNSDNLYRDKLDNIYFSKIYNDILKIKNELNVGVYDPNKIEEYRNEKNALLYDKYEFESGELIIPEDFIYEKDIELITE